MYFQTPVTSSHLPSSCWTPACTTPTWRTRPHWSASSVWTEASIMAKIFLMSFSRWEPFTRPHSALTGHIEFTSKGIRKRKQINEETVRVTDNKTCHFLKQFALDARSWTQITVCVECHVVSLCLHGLSYIRLTCWQYLVLDLKLFIT